MTDNLAIYVHWPFCRSKCPYCDFNSHVRDRIEASDFENAYLKEIDYFKDLIRGKIITSIFFGGGTPSLMPERTVANIISHLSKYGNFSGDIEVTLEANPTSSESNKFLNLKNAGINRLSIGVQSLRDKHLKFLGREHNSKEALNVIENAAKIFDNYSFDLMYSLPEQEFLEWQEDLEQAVNLATNHISLYQLTIEKGTKFFSKYKNKEFKMPGEKESIKFYEYTSDFLESRGFVNYEISNFAKKNYESKHNLTYWHYKPYLGLGAGAHSRIHYSDNLVEEIIMQHSPENWLHNVNSFGNAVQSRMLRTVKEQAIEKIIMGLRLKDGIDISNITQYVNLAKIQNLINGNILKFENNILRTTKTGKLVLNSILGEIIE